MAYYQQQPYGGGNPFASAYSPQGGYPGGQMGYQPQPMMMQPAPMMMASPQPMMMGQPSMMMGQQGSKVRCMGICDIVCSSIMIVGAFFGMFLPFVDLSTSEYTRDKPPILWVIYAIISAFALVIYIVNLVFVCGVISIARSGGIRSTSKVTGWIVTQVLTILVDLAEVGVCFYYEYYFVGGSLFAVIIHCAGICIACQFKGQMQTLGGVVGGAAVAPSVTMTSSGSTAFDVSRDDNDDGGDGD